MKKLMKLFTVACLAMITMACASTEALTPQELVKQKEAKVKTQETIVLGQQLAQASIGAKKASVSNKRSESLSKKEKALLEAQKYLSIAAEEGCRVVKYDKVLVDYTDNEKVLESNHARALEILSLRKANLNSGDDTDIINGGKYQKGTLFVDLSKVTYEEEMAKVVGLEKDSERIASETCLVPEENTKPEQKTVEQLTNELTETQLEEVKALNPEQPPAEPAKQ